MTHDEREAKLRGMRGTSRQAFGLVRDSAGLTDAQIRAMLSRNGSINDRLEPLLEAGLIRPASKVGRQTVYEATPLADVEEAAERWGVRRKKKKHRGAKKPRLSDLRTMVPGGTSAEFYREWTYITGTASHTRANEVQMFWETAPFHEVEFLAPLVEEMIEAGQNWLASYKVRKEEDDRRRRVAKMEETNGRTPEEIEQFKRGIEKLERKAL